MVGTSQPRIFSRYLVSLSCLLWWFLRCFIRNQDPTGHNLKIKAVLRFVLDTIPKYQVHEWGGNSRLREQDKQKTVIVIVVFTFYS